MSSVGLPRPSSTTLSCNNSCTHVHAIKPSAHLYQVHGAVLHDGQRVVLKIQYPGVARSISSDVDNLMRIISIANVLPKGLYVEQAATVRTCQPLLSWVWPEAVKH